MVLDPGSRHYRPIGWDDAFALLADELRAAGPDGTSLYTSGRTSNEAAFLYQLVGRLFGTNNFPDCSNMCHESSGVGLGEVVGVGKGTVSLEDFDHADLILVIGQNPGTNHPRMLTTLREAARRGATIVSVNPLREVGLARFAHPQHPLDVVRGGVPLAADFVQVRVGGDLALVRGIGKAVLELEEARGGVLDDAFLDELTTGYEAWAAAARATPWDAITSGSGVDEAQIRHLAERYAGAERVIACWAMGLTQHKHAVPTIQEVVNLMLLRGNVGRPGAGLCPVRGHSNVQGDRTMGIAHQPKPAFLDALGAAFGFEPPRAAGLDVVDTIRAMRDGRVTAFVSLGGNFLSATPDTEVVARALERQRLTCSVSTKLNRTHLYPGRRALILPCLGRTEVDVQAGGTQFVTVEDSMSFVHRSQGVLAPAGEELLSEPAIVARLGAALVGPRPGLDWAALAGDYDRVRDLIAKVVPGFADFNARVRAGAGFQLPNGARDRSFAGVGGRARFTTPDLPDLSLPPGRLRMMTLRSHDQYNTTIYGLDDRYRGVKGERRVVYLHSADMVERGLVERQLVDLDLGVERRGAGRAPLHRGAVRPAAGLRRDLLPRGQPAGPARLDRRQVQHADLEVGRHPGRAGPPALSAARATTSTARPADRPRTGRWGCRRCGRSGSRRHRRSAGTAGGRSGSIPTRSRRPSRRIRRRRSRSCCRSGWCRRARRRPSWCPGSRCRSAPSDSRRGWPLHTGRCRSPLARPA